jgi:hypothetical protein
MLSVARQPSQPALEIERYGTGKFQRKVNLYSVVVGRVHFASY